VSQPLHFDEAIQALKRDPSHPVRVKVDEELTVEVRALLVADDGAGVPVGEKKKTAADVFREIGRWEGETGEELDALFANIRQRSNRQVPDLK
jgi:hypothetical protein